MTCASPESETARGDCRDNSRLDDYSLEASKKQNATDREYRARLEAISTEGFPEQVRLSHDLLLHGLDNRTADYDLAFMMRSSVEEACHSICWKRAWTAGSEASFEAPLPDETSSTSFVKPVGGLLASR
jgi:uncharacterized protein (DUF885 family)